MPRRMSCSLTVDAVRERRKTVTRRHVDTWRNLRPGDRLTLVEKGMGLPKGSRQVVLAEVEVPAPLLIAMWALIPAFVVSVGERDMWDDGRAVEWGQMHDALKRATRGRMGR